MKTIFFLLAVSLVLSCNTEKKEETREVKQYTIEQFYGNSRIGGGAFSSDESALLVSSDESGIFNLYEIDIQNGTKKQLTHSEEESFFAIDYVPGTGEILYSADKGGNEINHIYLLKEDGTTTDLTPDEKAKSSFGGWSEDKKSMYYLSNKRDPKYFDMYKMNMSDKTSEMLYENEEGFSISGMSPDENMLALRQSITTSENRLFLYNRKTEKTTEVSDPDNPGNYSASGFGKDGKHFFYTSNKGAEFQYLMKYEIESGKSSVLYKTDWDVMYSYVSENEKYRVIAINKDGKNVLVVLDNASGKEIEFPQVPGGDIVAVSISESEEKMRLTVGTSRSPNNLYVYHFDTGEIKKLTETLNPEINREELVSAKVVRFKSFDGLEIPAIYYKPHTATADNKVPALVWVHGGPGGQSRTGYSSLIQYLVNNGYAILAVNNRGSSGYGKTFYKMDDKNHGDKDLKDCIWGKKWLQEQEYIDTEKIGIIGGSYGGYMTMAAMTFEPDEFKVGVNIFGVTNWLRTLKSIPPYWESFRKALYEELGDPNTADSVRLYNISPLFHANRIKNPVMVLQGANDPRVLQVESDEIVEAMRKNDIPVEYIVFPDEGHGFVKKENEIKGYGQILKFLDTYLKGGNTEEK
ncbi:S9 family peptidase [Sinomicrobium weinanense]|uniref:S9 family peptidase n=1 Tax=Sinomicrobium weinanense TaxID=2842200 RepID=A0A926Q3U5_9FLAO|nr:S9 family peptidase [Sinomicrobium weinanense]MBC9797289.1 S9 family peptidase [Sinomicrobium weinanense]MBU3125422.1 S9 family peptidase [Sinomicrobium weinanense]